MAEQNDNRNGRWTRRQFLLASLAGGVAALNGASALRHLTRPRLEAETFIASATSYTADLRGLISRGLTELGVSPREIEGKRILLKPNLVETHRGAGHINTHPLVVRGAVEAFLGLGAAKVVVGEGPGHRRDTLDVLEESGLADVLYEDHISFLNLNYEDGMPLPNRGRQTGLSTLTFPRVFDEVDWIVSMAKLKTHHWVGATLSMKNLFGVMPGIYYGWPKNVLHHAGITNSILDIAATLKPNFAIVDGVIGMEGDGPIMGTPIASGVIVMGRNLPAVDATCCRVMGIDPAKISYLKTAADWIGPIDPFHIRQRGESIGSVHKPFALLEDIPAQANIRLLPG